MDEGHRKILQNTIILFRRDMVKVVEVVEHLWTEEILSESMKDEILSNSTEGNKASALHMLLPKRGQNAFEAYCRALRETSQSHLADRLEQPIAVGAEMQREGATASGGTDQASARNQPKQTDQDEPDQQENTFGADIEQNLMQATEKGQTEIVREILKQFQERTSLCQKALKTAMKHRRVETAQLVLDAVANMKLQEGSWNSALHLYSGSRPEEAMEWTKHQIICDQLSISTQEFKSLQQSRDKEEKGGLEEKLLRIGDVRGEMYQGNFNKLLKLLEETSTAKKQFYNIDTQLLVDNVIAARESYPRSDESISLLHERLYRSIGDQLPTNSWEFKAFMRFIPLTTRDKETNCGSAEELLQAWEAQKGIYPGNYDNLLNLLADARLIKVLDLVMCQIDGINKLLLLPETTTGSPNYDSQPRSEESISQLHKQLYQIIGEELPIESNEFQEFKYGIPLSPRDRYGNCGSAEELLESWESRGGISLGKYDKLLQLLLDLTLTKIHDKAKHQIDKIQKLLIAETEAGSPNYDSFHR